MKKSVIAILLLCAFGIGQANAAQVKIGVLDVRSLMQRSPQVKAISAKLQKRFKPRQEKIIAAGKSLQEDVATLKRDEAILTTAQKTQIQERILRNKRDLDRLQQDYKQDTQVAQQQEMQKFFAKLKTVVDTFAKAEHYDLIIQKQAAPFSNKSVDVTDKLLPRLS